MTVSPRLSLPYLAPQQAQKHVTVNEALRRLDAIVQLTVASAATAAEPGAPDEGEAYILPEGATGAAWSLMAAGAIAAFQDGAWAEIEPEAGWRAYVADTGVFLAFDGAAWSGAARVERLGVNADADDVNRLTVSSDAALFTHAAAGDARVIVNKEDTGSVASHLFQSGFSGRAEFGLAGTDEFSLKVSADGAAWTEALLVSTDGRIGLGVDGSAILAPFQISDGAAVAAEFATATTRVLISAENVAPDFVFGVAGSSANTRGSFKAVRARGTLQSPSAAQSGDGVLAFFGAVHDGAAQQTTAEIAMAVDGAVSSGVCPQRIDFRTGATNGASRATRLVVTSTGTTRPGADNIYALGSGSFRWSEVFAANGTINTSDAREKSLRGALSAAEARAARRLLKAVVAFRWKDAEAKKGEAARLHVGFTAQDVKDAFAAEGLDAARYGLWCEDAIVETVSGEDGSERQVATGRTSQGLRYTELFAFLFAALAEAL